MPPLLKLTQPLLFVALRHILLISCTHIFCVDIMPSAQLLNAQILGPIPEDFDFSAHLKVLEGIPNFKILLTSHIAKNAEIEKANNNSILQTALVKSTPIPCPDNLDIGPTLKPPSCYSLEELQELIDSETLCTALGPLPVSLIQKIVAKCTKLKTLADVERQANKEKEKEVDSKLRSKLLRTLRLNNPIKHVMAKATDVIILTTYLLGILNKCTPPLNFFTNKHLETVNYRPQDVHTKLTQTLAIEDGASTAEKVQLLNLLKMIALWGLDDHSSCLTPFCFLEASNNLLKALKMLSTPITSDNEASTTTYAIEYSKHHNFFAQHEYFETTYPFWYDFELKAWREILKGVCFNWDVYALEVTVILQAWELVNQSTTSTFKCSSQEVDFCTPKAARQSVLSDASSACTLTSFQEGGPTCLLCRQGHQY
jgi:hypothetical protein